MEHKSSSATCSFIGTFLLLKKIIPHLSSSAIVNHTLDVQSLEAHLCLETSVFLGIYIEDFGKSKISVYIGKSQYTGNFGISVWLKKSYCQTDMWFNSGIPTIPNKNKYNYR